MVLSALQACLSHAALPLQSRTMVQYGVVSSPSLLTQPDPCCTGSPEQDNGPGLCCDLTKHADTV